MQNPDKLSKNVVKVEGVVEESLAGATFRVKTYGGKEVLAYLSGKMRMFNIKILPGDRVTMDMTPSDQTRGRITRRL